ncbi:hypothetical protein F511_23381 [Dorcoceras hygrometricum]|uniref:Uncharacterized protein n=1 Tax=Dorcoceras hygrometricum TaxID=472368 RepID=A0A2Z7B8T9_9LAMI|nr:hypothetical protein F511_23381 [Dorcoceras hygrometricum]
MRKPALQTVGGGRSSIGSMTGIKTPSSACTRRTDEFNTDGNTSAWWPEQFRRRGGGGGGAWRRPAAATCVTLNGSGIQLAVGPQPLWLRNHNFGLSQRIMVDHLATSPHDHLGITDSACKNQLVMVSVQYGPFNTYIPIRSTTIGKSRVAIDPIAMHTSWRSNSDIANNIGYPCMSASGESSTTMHRLLHASGSHPSVLGPYCTLTTTNWFLQALSVIPRGSWGDVARRFTMIRWDPDPPLRQQAISAGLKINWAHVLFRTLVAMVTSPAKQSQGYAVQLSILLEKLVKADLGESVALHPLKVLNTKPVLTYLKKNQAAPKSGDASKASGDKADAPAELKKEKMTLFDEWARFRTEVRLNSITSMTLINNMAKLEDDFMLWAETKKVSELLQCRLLIQYRLYEEQLQEAVDKHRTEIDKDAPSVNYDHMCIRFLERELKQIMKQHRFQRFQVVLPIMEPAKAKEAEQEMIEKPAQELIVVEELPPVVQYFFVEEAEAIDSLEQPAPVEEPTDNREKQQAQVDSIPSSPIDSGISIYSSDSSNNEERQVPYSSGLSILQYTSQQANMEAAPDLDQAGQQPVHISTSMPAPFDVILEITSNKKVFESLESSITQMGDDQKYLKYDSKLFRQVFYRRWMSVVATVNTSQSALKTNLVRKIDERDQYFAVEMTSVRSKLAEMVNCIKELSDSKKGEGGSSKKRRLV